MRHGKKKVNAGVKEGARIMNTWQREKYIE